MAQYVSRAQEDIGWLQDQAYQPVHRLDYKKACNSMPHTRMPECLKMYNINMTLKVFIKNSVLLWKTTMETNSKPIGQVTKCGTYQDDLLLPLLFWTPSARLSQRLAMDNGSEVEQPSVTSSTWIISSCVSGMSKALTYWSTSPRPIATTSEYHSD